MFAECYALADFLLDATFKDCLVRALVKGMAERRVVPDCLPAVVWKYAAPDSRHRDLVLDVWVGMMGEYMPEVVRMRRLVEVGGKWVVKKEWAVRAGGVVEGYRGYPTEFLEEWRVRVEGRCGGRKRRCVRSWMEELRLQVDRGQYDAAVEAER